MHAIGKGQARRVGIGQVERRLDFIAGCSRLRGDAVPYRALPVPALSRLQHCRLSHMGSVPCGEGKGEASRRRKEGRCQKGGTEKGFEQGLFAQRVMEIETKCRRRGGKFDPLWELAKQPPN